MRTLIVCRTALDPALAPLKELLRSAKEIGDPQVTLYDQWDRHSHAAKTDLVIVSLTGDPAQGHELIRRLRQSSETRIIAVGPIADSKLILRTLQMGAHFFLDQDDLRAEFASAMERLFPKAGPIQTTGRLLAVIAASGGCGGSTLAVNLAALLARDHGKSGLIDLNPGRGDLSCLLDLKPQFSLVDVCLNEARLDRAMLEKMMSRHSSGIHLLAAPTEFEDVRSLTPSGVKQAIALSRTLFPETVVDLEDCVHAEQIDTLRQATHVFVVCRLDFTSLRNSRRLLACLQKLDVPRHLIKVVVNQRGQCSELPVEEAERALGEPLTAFVPYDPKTINTSNNTGMPAVLKFPDAPVVQSISQLIAFGGEPQPIASGFFRRIKSLVLKNPADTKERLKTVVQAEGANGRPRHAFEH